MEQGLAAEGNRQKHEIRLGDGEKLILVMLCQLFKHLKLKGGEIDLEFVEDVIFGGRYWGLDWKYNDLYHGHEDSRAVVTEVLNILDMWYFLERGFTELSQE